MGNLDPLAIGLIALGFLVLLIMLGIHVGVAMAFVGFVGLIFVTGSFSKAFPILLTTPYSTVVSYAFIIIPLFVLMGSFASYGGFGEGLYDAASKWLGRIPGGLAMATTWACLLFGASSGSNIASAAIFTKISLPEMAKRGYDLKFSVGAIVSSSMLTAIMPPSLILVIYGVMTEQPIGLLLIAGVIPSVVLAAGISFYIWSRAKLNPHLAPKEEIQVTWKQRIISLKGAWMMVALGGIVLGGIYSGVFSPTEAAATGSFAAFIFALIARRLNWHTMREILMESVGFSVMILFILIGAYIFARFLAVSQFPTVLLNALLSLNVPGMAIIVGLMLIYLFLGCFMGSIEMMAITLPIVFPAIVAMGYSPIWFGIILLIGMVVGAMTPPFGLSVFAVKSATNLELSIEDMFRGCIPYLTITAVVWGILIAFPQISLLLPNLMIGK